MSSTNNFDPILNEFANQRIAVVGDLMMDEYLWGAANRISPESPVMVVDIDRETCVPGGAANVVNNLLALGAQVSVFGVVGRDSTGDRLIQLLQEVGANVTGIIRDDRRPTTRKTRVVAHSQQVLRIDREDSNDISDEIADGIAEELARSLPEIDAILISDYRKGVIVPQLATRIIADAGSAGVPVVANPKPESVSYLKGATVVSLNQSEADRAYSLLVENTKSPFASDDTLERHASQLREAAKFETLLVTRGARGLVISSYSDGFFTQSGHPVEVYDVAGAGDTVISAYTLALSAGANAHQCASIANYAAACVVRKLGVATVDVEELRGNIR